MEVGNVEILDTSTYDIVLLINSKMLQDRKMPVRRSSTCDRLWGDQENGIRWDLDR